MLVQSALKYGLVATPMPLDIKLHPEPTRVENWLTSRVLALLTLIIHC